MAEPLLRIRLDGALPAGDAGIERAYRQHWAALCRFVRRSFGPGPPEPEDVAQAAFASFVAVADPDRVRNPRAFLYRSAANYVINQRRHGAICERHAMEQKNLHPSAGTPDELTPESVLLDRERLAIVERAIQAMPAKRRRYLLLNRIDGLGFSEIARQEGLTESAVRAQVAKASLAIARAIVESAGGNAEGEAG